MIREVDGEIEQLLAEQARYYRERAGEYDDWWFRRGRYDQGADMPGACERSACHLHAGRPL